MNERHIFWTAPGLICLAFSLAACGSSGLTPDGYFFSPYHFRLTVEIDTPDGVRRGSSVIEVRRSIVGGKIKGEAAAVELPGGQTLFVLLRSSDLESSDWALEASEWIPDNLQESWGRSAMFDPYKLDHAKRFWTQVAFFRGTVSVSRTRKLPWGDMDTYPIFVRFRNIADPQSVELVDRDDLARSFGTGYRLKSLRATFTADPVTHEIEKRLPWLESVGRRRGSLRRIARYQFGSGKVPVLTLIEHVSSNDFSTELYKDE